MKVYHYTKGYAVESILNEGIIELEGTRGKIAYKPLTSFVWLTCKNTYPRTALPYVNQLPYTLLGNHLGSNKPNIRWDELSEIIGGIFRFEFLEDDDRIQRWKYSDFRMNNIQDERYRMLERTANKCGDDINSFYFSTVAMELKSCKLQKYINGDWIDLLVFDGNGQVACESKTTLDNVITMCKQRKCA